jgi:hypothetical protein
VAASAEPGAVAVGDAAGVAAAPARVPDAGEPSPPPQPAKASTAAKEMQFSFAWNGKRMFNPRMEIVWFNFGTDFFPCYLDRGKATPSSR